MDDFPITESLTVATSGGGQIVDLSDAVREILERHGLQDGNVLVFVPGSTGAITTIEHEPGLLRDMPELFERLVPSDRRYHHDDTWHDGNGHAHLRASLIGPSLTVPVAAGRLLLGTWQQVVLLDFDNRPRQRQVVIQLNGRR